MRSTLSLLAFSLTFTSSLVAAARPAAPIPQTALQALEWREVGPYRGGRSAAVAGIPGDPQTYYFGATGGGVWKTTDAGRSWKNVSDGFFGGSIGAVAVSEWDPNVVYVGGGESTVRGNVSHGNGMWRSLDAGRTWTHIGLEDSRHIARIRIHPRDPDRVWVAVMGHLFGPSEERGIYRTTDGGATWTRVLYVSSRAGAFDLALDPTNPRILYATFWRVLRTPWSLESGGEGSSMWKSTDGGDHWTELTANPGLPRGTLGIMGITVSPTDGENLYAMVEAEEGGLFRSRDGGATWTRTSSDRRLRQRAWYYSRVVADPADAESVYVLNVRFHHSKDGGKTFSRIATPHGDNHDLWIAPENPRRMIEANDGGATVSLDGGATWTTQRNQPTAQFYRVSTDNDFPYRLLGGQQDNSAVRIRSRSATGSAIGDRDWEPTAGGESGHIVAKPDAPDIVFGGSYGGFLVRFDHRTAERRAVNVWPDDPMGWGAAELEYRFQWNFPVFFSPHDPNRLYAAANVLFASDDGGATWRTLSGDLTRNDKTKMGPSGGPITKDNTSVEYYGTIFAAAESPHEPGVLWTGSDDGLVYLSRDAGDTWKNVTPKDLPEWTQVNSIEVDPFHKGGLYLAATRYKLDDFRPYLFKTEDFGASWRRVDGGIPPDAFTRVVRADPDRQGLLYAGTERGVWVSFDDGGSWQPLQLNLPIVPITDLAVKEQDLVAATQGRGFWILDDLSVLHQIDPEIAAGGDHLFTPRPAYRLAGGRSDEPGNRGTNPPDGVILRYLLAAGSEGEGDLVLEILEPDGDVIQRFTRAPDPEEEAPLEAPEAEDERGPRTDLLPAEAGLNRFVWDLRYPPMERFPGLVLWNDVDEGPRAVPGTYRARLTHGDWSQEVEFRILEDPRASASLDALRAQFAFALSVRDTLSEIHRAIGRLRAVRDQFEALDKRLDATDGSPEIAAFRQRGKSLLATLDEIEKALYQTRNRSPQDPLNFPVRLNDKLAGLLRLVSLGDAAPTAQALAVKEKLTGAARIQLERLAEVWRTDVPELNRLAAAAAIPVLLLPDEDEPSD